MTAPAPSASPLEIANLLLRHWRTLFGFTLGAAALFAGLSLVARPTYVAQTAFIQAEPARSAIAGGLGALASRFGFAGSGEATASLDFLSRALTSRDVLDSVLVQPLVVTIPDGRPLSIPGAPDTIGLAAWFGIDEPDPAKRLDAVRRRVLKNLAVDADQRSGIVRVSMRMRDPDVAAAFVRRIVDALNDFNLHTRQTVSRANRVFLEGRVQDARLQLAAAEDRLRRFYEENRRINDAPALIFDEGSLRRQVDLAQQIYVTLAQELEQARIDEVKDTPVLTVIETAQPPVLRASPRRKLLTILGGFAGLIVGLLVVAGRHHLQRAAGGAEPAWQEFREHITAVPGGRYLERFVMGRSSAASR